MRHQDDVSIELIRKLDDRHPLHGRRVACRVLYGEPRTTQDIDIVIEATPEQIEAFAGTLGEDQYVSLDAARAALDRRSMFNVIDTTSGWKIDLIVRKSRPYDIEAFGRRRQAKLLGQEIWVLSPEDAILSKLEWSRKSDSERQLRDAESVVVIQWDRLDMDYLRHWALELRVEAPLEKIIEHARLLQDGAS